VTSFAVHGGNVYAAARQTGFAVRRLLDFSASINPLGPSPKALRAARLALSRVGHYPDPECVRLRETLAKRFQLPSSQFLIGNGSSELIHLLPAVLAVRYALIVGPTFSEYERAINAYDGRVLRVQAQRSDGYRPPVHEVVATLGRKTGIDAVFLCNPNSPTGRTLTRDEMREILSRAGRRTPVIVDETFVDYCEGQSMLPQLDEHPNLIVLRSLTKFYALPGLRIGYVAASEKIIRRIGRKQAPWSVNTLAQEAAIAALGDRAHARRALAFMEQERPRFAEMFCGFEELVLYPSEANYFLVELHSISAPALCAVLRRCGILIRDCSTVPGLSKQTIRLAIRTTGQNRRLVAALHAALG
jgi:threonine-phosphate decarboxylase